MASFSYAVKLSGNACLNCRAIPAIKPTQLTVLTNGNFGF